MSGAPNCNILPSLLSRLTMFTLLTLGLATGTASAQYCTPDQCDECSLSSCCQNCCHSLPDLWLINTRCAPRCSNLDDGFDRLTYKRYDRKCGRWVRESHDAFLAQEATMPTLFYSHGNSLNHKNAMRSCWLIYKKMRCCPGSKRLVFWSWPAERVYKTKGLRIREMIKKNLRLKYVYAEYQGYYMAKLVDQMSLTQRVMISGHSYGAISSASAAHLLGGGQLRGLTLAGAEPIERPNLRCGVISGAFDHDMLIPGHRYGQAFVGCEKIFVTRNIHDRTLKNWPKTSLKCRRAIGTLGVNANQLGEYRPKLCQQTMSLDVGTSHYLKPHLNSVRFVSALCCLSFNGCQQNCLVENPTDSTASLAVTDAPLDFELALLEDDLTGPTISLWDHEELNEMDLADVLAKGISILSANTSTPNETKITSPSLTAPLKTELQPIAPRPIGPQLSQPRQIANSDIDTTTAAVAPALLGPTTRSPATLKPEAAAQLQQRPLTAQKAAEPIQIAGQGAPPLLGGLLILFVLVGQFFVFFRNRVTTF